MSKIIYNFDMDGVLAKWGNSSVEETFLEGYFAARAPEPVVIEVLERLVREGKSVNILSAAYENGYAVPEKSEWLDRNIRVSGYQKTFVPYGKDKNSYMPHAAVNVLIDDFSKNLHQWVKDVADDEANIAIKFYNGINGNNGTWTSYSVTHRMSAEEIYIVITSIAEKIATR